MTGGKTINGEGSLGRERDEKAEQWRGWREGKPTLRISEKATWKSTILLAASMLFIHLNDFN